jgi:ABC-type transporter Mla subunit MlaD
MADFDRTLELVNISQESSGATNAQQVEFMRGLEAALINLQTAYQGFIKNITDSEAIIGIVRTLTFLIESLTVGFESLGFYGKNAMVVLISLAGVMKSTSVISALLQKQQTAELLTKKLLTAGLVKQTYLQLALNIAKKKEALVTTLNTAAQAKYIGMTKLGILALKAKVIAMTALNAVMAVNPFILVAMAIAGVALAIGAAMKNTKQNTTALKEQNEEIQAAQYQFKQLDKSLKSSLDKIEELNKLAFLTPEQEKQLDDAKEKIAELVGEENIIRDSRGRVDLDASETAVKAFLENQKNLLNQSIETAYTDAIDKLKNSTAGMYGSSTAYMGTLDPNNINAIYTKILNEHEKAFGTVSPVVAALYKEKIIDKLSTGEGATSLATNLSDFMETEASNTLNFLQKSIEEIQALEGDLVDQVDTFNKKIDSGNEEQVELLEKQYASLAALRQEYGVEASKEVAKNLQTAGIADLKSMQKAMSTFGESLPEVLEKVSKRVEDIMSDDRISPETALSMA